MSANLPVVLIGPILRRVDPRNVCVFIATSISSKVRVTLYDGVVDAAKPPPPITSAQGQTTAFGGRFHATVVTVSLDVLPLMPGHLYSYDVLLTPEDQPDQSLKDMGFLRDDKAPGYGTAAPANADVEVSSLGYAEGQLPSFVTCPDTLDKLVLAHASCRKPHGAGDPAFGYFDDIIDDPHQADDRPHMLFLTGDQIYADDVAAALLPGLTALGAQLLGGGGAEQVPSRVSGGAPLDVSQNVMPAGFRQ